MKFWAHMHTMRKTSPLGPFATREEAIAKGREVYGAKLTSRKQFLTGYGEGGAWFDIRFHGKE